MSEFQEVCKHLKRMCERYGNNCIKCPLDDNDFCSLSAGDRTAETYKKAEEIIMSWAAEHPEPVYPTWWKYMCMIGVIPDELGDKTLGEITVYSLMNTHIQSDIAERLGIEPEEGV